MKCPLLYHYKCNHDKSIQIDHSRAAIFREEYYKAYPHLRQFVIYQFMGFLEFEMYYGHGNGD